MGIQLPTAEAQVLLPETGQEALFLRYQAALAAGLVMLIAGIAGSDTPRMWRWQIGFAAYLMTRNGT